MKKLLILLALGTLPAFAQGLPGSHQPQQPDCLMEANGENGPGISCKGIEWPPQPKNNQPPVGVFNAKAFAQHPGAPDVKELVRAGNYKGPEPIGVEAKLDRFERAVPRFTPRQVADKTYWILGVVIPVGSAVFDIESAQYGLRRGGGEFNPILGRHRPRQYGVKFGLIGFNAFLLYKYKKWDMQDGYVGNKISPMKWWQAAFIWPVVNFGAGAYNFARAAGRPVVHH